MTDEIPSDEPARSVPAAAADGAARLIGGRYLLLDELGRGGAGIVRRAEDQVLKRMVAVKSIRPGLVASEPRIRREIAAMRLLRIPGVAILHDEIEQAGQTHLVMDLILGSPFPGPYRVTEWEPLAPLVRSLLSILGRVHAAGVVHRDLKPSNILVDAQGTVTIVDFGLAHGTPLGSDRTATGALVGTPQYMAPEQFRSQRPDGRTDLYALAVMLYEILSGRAPFDADEFADLMRRKLSGAFVPLGRTPTKAPRKVTEVIDRMLALDPGERPQSAAETARLIFGEGAPADGEQRLPRLGSGDALTRVLAALRSGSPVDVSGARGSGRSRLLTDAARALEADGRKVVWTVRGKSPYASLGPVLGGFEGLERLSRDDAFAALDERLRKTLHAGVVVCADDTQLLDEWSARSLGRLRTHGSVVRVVSDAGPDGVVVSQLAAEDLRPLFAGRSRIHHIPEDAADELWRRTGGQPALVRGELAAWIRQGLAHWVDGRVAVDRAVLRRLHGGLPLADTAVAGAAGTSGGTDRDDLLAWVVLAWPHGTPGLLAHVSGRPLWMLEPEVEALVEQGLLRRLPDGRLQPLVIPDVLQIWSDDVRQRAHRSLGGALPAGTPERLRHLAAAGEPQEVTLESIALGRSCVEAGRSGDALAALALGLESARRAEDPDAFDRAFREFLVAAMADGTADALHEAIYELDRAPAAATFADDPAHAGRLDRARVRDLLRASLEALRGDPALALRQLRACGTFADEEVELRRQSLRSRCASKLPVHQHAAVIDDIREWAESTKSGRAQDNVHTWTAILRMRQGRFAEAAEIHLADTRAEIRPQARIGAYLNAAQCFLDLGDLSAARSAACSARDLAAACRHPVYEAHAESLEREMAYRLGDAPEPDADLVDAIASLGSPDLTAFVAQTEAAVAWRCGRRAEAAAFALRAETESAVCGNRSGVALSHALRIACDESVPVESSFLDGALALSDPAEVLQILALAAPRSGASAERVRRGFRKALAAFGDGDQERRREVLSVAEAQERIGGASTQELSGPGNAS